VRSLLIELYSSDNNVPFENTTQINPIVYEQFMQVVLNGGVVAARCQLPTTYYESLFSESDFVIIAEIR